MNKSILKDNLDKKGFGEVKSSLLLVNIVISFLRWVDLICNKANFASLQRSRSITKSLQLRMIIKLTKELLIKIKENKLLKNKFENE